MNKYELVVAVMLLSLSTVMKICTLVVLCHNNNHLTLEEIHTEPMVHNEKKGQTNHTLV